MESVQRVGEINKKDMGINRTNNRISTLPGREYTISKKIKYRGCKRAKIGYFKDWGIWYRRRQVRFGSAPRQVMGSSVPTNEWETRRKTRVVDKVKLGQGTPCGKGRDHPSQRAEKEKDKRKKGAAGEPPRSDTFPSAPIKCASEATLFGANGRYISTTAIPRAAKW